MMMQSDNLVHFHECTIPKRIGTVNTEYKPWAEALAPFYLKFKLEPGAISRGKFPIGFLVCQYTKAQKRIRASK